MTGLVACSTEDGDSDSTAADLAAELLEPGPYSAGYRQLRVTYRPAASDENRTVDIEVWYPSEETDGSPANYAVGGLISIDAEGALAEPAPAGGDPFPVVVYSHGNGGVGLLAYPYAEYLASHGWLVASPDHTGNTALDFFFERNVPTAQSALDRPQDISAVLDGLELLSDDPLAGRAATDDVMLFGHSFGGYTTFAVAGSEVNPDTFGSFADDPEVAEALGDLGDPRVTVIVPQAPAIGFLNAAGITGLSQPTMLQTARLDQTTTQEASAEPSWAALDGADDLWVEVEAGGHITFLSVCYDLDDSLLDALYPDGEEEGCGDSFIDAAEAVPLLAGYLRAFGDIHRLGDDTYRDLIYGPAFADGFVTTTP